MDVEQWYLLQQPKKLRLGFYKIYREANMSTETKQKHTAYIFYDFSPFSFSLLFSFWLCSFKIQFVELIK